MAFLRVCSLQSDYIQVTLLECLLFVAPEFSELFVEPGLVAITPYDALGMGNRPAHES